MIEDSVEWTCLSSTIEHLLRSFMHLLFLLIFYLLLFFNYAGSLPDKRLVSLQPVECRCALRLFWLQLQNAFIYWTVVEFSLVPTKPHSRVDTKECWQPSMSPSVVSQVWLHVICQWEELPLWASPDDCTLPVTWGRLRFSKSGCDLCLPSCSSSALCPVAGSSWLALMECLETYCQLLPGDGKCN